MVLHSAKVAAILQWFNSLTECNAASIHQMRDGKLFCDVIKSVFKLTDDPSVHKDENCTEPIASSSQIFVDLNESNPIVNRYKLLKEFIDGTYQIESGNLIKYEDCEKSDELELAKVAIFILNSVVIHFLKHGNEQLQTLTHLDINIQEDIQDCLFLLVKDVDKLPKEEINKVLSRAAKYKVSPHKRNSSTPKRSCSSKYITKDDDVFSNSPLRSILQSPKIEDSYDKQESFMKKRKEFCDKEARIDDLETKVQELESQLKERDGKINNLKKLAKQRKSKGEYKEPTESKTCKTCRNLKAMGNKSIERGKLGEENERLRQMIAEMKSEHENELQALETRLQGKRKQTSEWMQKFYQLTYKDIDRKREIEELKKVIEQLKESNEQYLKEVSFLNERISSTNRRTQQEVEEDPSMTDHWQAGGIIEALNRQKLEDQNAISISTTQTEAFVVADKFSQTEGNSPLHQRTQYQQISVMQLDSSLDKDLCDPEPLPVCWQMETNVLEAKQTSTELECVAACSSLQDGGASSDTSSSIIMRDSVDFCAVSMDTQNDMNMLETKQNSINYESAEAHTSACNADAPSDTSSHSNFDDVTDKCNPKQEKDDSDLTEITQAPSNRLGSLWINYSKPVNEKCEKTCDSNNKLDLAKLGDLLKQLGISDTEYSSRKTAVKELWAVLKEVFAPNGSNGFVGLRTLGDWDQSINSDEDQLQCLLYIRESLLKFQNNNSVSKDSTFTEKSCGCHSTYNENLNKLNKEKDDLILKLTKLQKNLNIQMQQQELKKIALQEKDKLLAEFSRTIEKCRYTLKKKNKMLREVERSRQFYTNLARENDQLLKKAEKKNEELLQTVRKKEEKYEELLQKADIQIKDLSKEVENAQKNYTSAVKEKDRVTGMLNKKLQTLNENIIQLTNDRNDFAQKICHEYSKKVKYHHDFIIMRQHCMKLLSENQNLKAYYQNGTPKLKSETGELELIDASKVKKAVPEILPKPHSSVSVTDNIRIKEEKESYSEEFETPKKDISSFEITANQFDDSLRDIKPQDRSTQSGALFNKHSFFLPTDDEESYLNHSSIAEIKSENTQRIKELQRRNSIVPPHMRSSYAPEVQCMSPFNKSFFDLVKHPLTKNDSSSSKKNGITIKVKPSIFSSAKKKRKISELDSNSGASSSKGLKSSPSWKRRVKNQSSFMKVLYRSNDKPKQQS